MSGRGGQARLTISLIDAVSGPAKAVNAALRGMNAQIGAMKNISLAPARELSRQAAGIRQAATNLAPVGAAMSLGIAKVGRDVYDLEKSLNVSQAAGGLNLQERNQLMAEAVKLNGQYAATSAGIVSGANELLRSGLNLNQTLGTLNGVLDASQAFDVPIADASAGIVRAMTQMRLEMRSTDEAMKNSTRIADLFAVSLNETAGVSFDDFQTSGKYFAPVGTAVGMTPEEIFAYQSTLAKAGIYGSSAGTGLRSAPVSIAAPSKGGRAAFGRLKINPADFVGGRSGAATGDMIAGSLEGMGFSAEGLEAGIQKMLDDPRVAKSPGKVANAILDRFGEELGVVTGEDRMNVAEAIQNSIAAGAKKVDLIGVLRSMRDRGAGLADYVGVFGKNHASKMMALDPDEYERQLKKMNDADGTAARQREVMMQGIVGDVNKLSAAWESMAVAIGKAGLLADAAAAISKMSNALNGLAVSNPELLRLGSYAALSVAALAPLGFAISGTAAAMALMVNPLALVAGSLGVLAALNIGPISDALSVFGKSLVRALDPKIIAGMVAMKDAVAGIFNYRIGGDGGDALGQMARNIGVGAAEMANAVGAALPNLTTFVDKMGALASGAIASALPGVTRVLQDIGVAISGFASDKVNTIVQMGTALADFGRRAATFADGSAAIGLVAASYNALAAGLGAVYRVGEGATKALVSFASAFLGQIDSAAIGSSANAIASAFNGLASALGWLKSGFDAIDLSFLNSLAEMAGGFTGSVISAAIMSVAAGIRTGADALMSAANALKSAAVAARDAIAAIPSAAWSAGPGLTGGGILGAMGVGQPASASIAPGVDGHRAAGGPLRRGMSYRVGERGPEVITPSTNGYVTPNHRLGGGGDVIVNIGTINAQGAGPNVGSDISKALEARLRRSRQVSMTGRPVS